MAADLDFEDCLERLARLEARARQLQHRLTPAENPYGRHSGVDSTGMVVATVDNQGVIRDLRIRDPWRDHLQAEHLGGAIRDAASSAGAARLAAWCDAVVHQPADVSARPLPLRIPPAVEPLLDTFAGSPERLQGMAAELESQASRTYEDRSVASHVTVTVNGAGALVDVWYDRGWISRATASSISRETLEALEAVYKRIEKLDFHSLITGLADPSKRW